MTAPKLGDRFIEGEMFLDRDEYVTRYQFWTNYVYHVVEIYKAYVVVSDAEGHKLKLYSNNKTDYFTSFPPAKFIKQWKYDPYYPRYYKYKGSSSDSDEQPML